MENPIDKIVKHQVGRAFRAGFLKGWESRGEVDKSRQQGVIMGGVSVEREVEKILAEKGF